MISVVCIYNNRQILDDNLLGSLKNQTAKFELILLNNIDNAFESAAIALNSGGSMATGKYIMFVHQDVILCSKYFLEDVEKTLDGIDDLGVAGTTGIDHRGREVGFILDRDSIWGKPVLKPELVQALDEEVLIVPKKAFSQLCFDSTAFNGWHCYGSDYSLEVKEKLGLGAYVIPAFIHHNSPSENVVNLPEYYSRLLLKHAGTYTHLYTPSATLNVRARLRLQPYIRFYRLLFKSFTDLLRNELTGCKTILNLSCGNKVRCHELCSYDCSGTELFSGYSPFLKRFYNYTYSDRTNADFRDKSFDAVLVLAGLDYLDKEEGLKIIQSAENWATKKVILSIATDHLKGNMPSYFSVQQTLWSILELREKGYRIHGLDWKQFYYNISSEAAREKNLILRIKDQVLNDLSVQINYRYPKKAKYILCTKKLNS